MRRARLEDKTIVVIGGTGGLGLSASRAFLAEGARVVVVGRDPARARATEERLGGAALALAGDAADPATAERAVGAAVERFGRLDGLYHVAGGSGRRFGDGPLHELLPDALSRTLDWNLASVVHSNRAALRQFLAQGDGGAVLNMGSVLGTSPSPRHFGTHAYAAAKAAIEGLTRSAAAYYAPRNIRLNVIAPALTETPMAGRAAGDPAILRYIRTKQPLDGGRIGRPEDADSAAVFFLSDESRFVTGQVLAVDGGWTVSEGGLAEEDDEPGESRLGPASESLE